VDALVVGKAKEERVVTWQARRLPYKVMFDQMFEVP